MNKYTGILAFMLILAMSAGIASSEQVVTKELTSMDGISAPEQAINFTKLEISPPYINFMLQPGETKEMTVTLKNKEKIAASVKPNTVLAPYGGYNVDPEWIKVTPESAEIPAGGSQKFTIKVTVPVDASIGNSGLQIAFTNETMQTPYPMPVPNYIHVLQVSLDIWATPKIQIMTPYITDTLEAGKEYDYEIKLKNTGTEPIKIDPKMSSDNARFYGGPFGQMSAAFTDDAINISAPSNVPAGATETVKLHVKVPEDAKGSYNGGINLNIDDPSIHVWDGTVQMNFNVWTQPAEAFERVFNLTEAAPITIEISSGTNYNPYGQATGADKKEPSFETTLVGPTGNTDIKATKTVIKGVVNMGGQIPPWELDSKGIYQENGVQLIETFKVNGSPGEWKLKVLPKNTESFEYSILIGE
jgi:hypothetical protein